MIINEVAWAGTKASQYGEWFELYNAGNQTTELTGWALYKIKTGGILVKIVGLSGTIEPGAFFLVERYTDTSQDPIDILADIQGNPAGKFADSGLSNTYEHLALLDAAGNAVDDTALCTSAQGSPKWCGGSASPSYVSMERVDPLVAGSDPSNWASNDGSVMVGADAAGGPIWGTPAHVNSVAASAP